VLSRSLAIIILWLASANVVASDVSQWLMKMHEAARSLNYDGIFVYVHGMDVEAMRVVHKSDQGVVRERIYSLNGAAREIIRDAERIWCYIPEKKIGVHEYRQVSKQTFPRILPERLGELKQNYRISLGNKGRIADRQAQQIAIMPKDQYRYGYGLWADQKTGLLLKAVLLNTDGKPIERYMFTNLTIGESIPEQALQPMTPKEDLIWFGSSEPKISVGSEGFKSDWQTKDVPSGFVLSRTIKRLSPLRKRMVEHFVYSDGLAAVSVFIEKLSSKDEKPISGISHMGSIHAFGKVVDGYQITVVGEVPSKTVGMLGKSVTRIKH